MMSGMKQAMRVMVFGLFLALAGLWTLGSDVPAGALEQKEKHPHIRAALSELKEARKELKEADHDFGGHRVEAIESIDKAIVQLEKCLKFDKK
jgi:hypothetical protein